MLTPGTKLGSYEITGQIGAGGMGEVYRARDTKLGRDVALKVLPEAFASDAERMGRFEREAKVLASLNHPNIATIHGLEESGATRALVMELVEGPTLADRIAQGPIPLDEALPIAKQICDALEYAHERGIVHRDLKPANVKITPDGMVKLLDFGLAKALEGDSLSGDMSNSPTISRMATQAGIILGTAAYMAPEQAKGRPVDRRADIWAFGCVLYEMLTGKKPFEGETISDVLAAVIMKDPDWSALPDATPAAIQKLLRRCLAKDLRHRLQAIGEARIAIEDYLANPSDASVPAATVAIPPKKRQWMAWAAAAVFFFILAAVFAFGYFRANSAPAAQPVSATILPPQNASFSFDTASVSVTGAPILSPDGSRLVFPGNDASGNESLWVRPLDSFTAQPLQGTDGAAYPFWAPDSRQIGFFQDGKLKKIAVSGGAPVTICDVPIGPSGLAFGGAWSSNDVIVFSSHMRLMSVPAAGGTPTAIFAAKASEVGFKGRWPVFLPDGRHFLYLSGDVLAPGTSKLGIHIGEIGSNEQKFLLQADSQAVYAAPGYLLFLRGGTLMAQRFDASSQKLMGGAVPVAEHVASPADYRLGFFSASQTGMLVYQTSTSVGSGGQLVWLDSSGKQIGKVGQPGPFSVQLSPDGQQAAYLLLRSEGGGADIWLTDLTRGVQTRFTFGSTATTINTSPVWSPHASRIAYFSAGQGIDVKDASGAGNAKVLLKAKPTGESLQPTDWSRNGRYILVDRASTLALSIKTSIWVLPLSGGKKPFPYLQTQFSVANGRFSPDGRWVAYQSDESGKWQVYLSPFPPGGGKWQVSQNGGEEPEWNRAGTALYYLAPANKMMEVSVKENGSAVEIGSPREVFQLPVAPFPYPPNYSVAPDGKRFLVNEASKANTPPPLTLVTHWTASLQK